LRVVIVGVESDQPNTGVNIVRDGQAESNRVVGLRLHHRCNTEQTGQSQSTQENGLTKTREEHWREKREVNAKVKNEAFYAFW
jgi:hypothetical protein